MMKEGGKATLVIPPELAYGDAGSGGKQPLDFSYDDFLNNSCLSPSSFISGAVPPGATLKFEVELFKVNP